MRRSIIILCLLLALAAAWVSCCAEGTSVMSSSEHNYIFIIDNSLGDADPQGLRFDAARLAYENVVASAAGGLQGKLGVVVFSGTRNCLRYGPMRLSSGRELLDASIGGMASTRASGTNAVRYGTMRDNILALKVVRADGEIITTGTRATKSSAGYDLTHLFVGAEGTLGIISELTIKLRGIPETIAAAACSFDTVRGACQATILAIQTGIPVARIELLNAEQVKACNSYSKLTLPETPQMKP